jgi:alpha-beta hydrolase superfamily lysophospholipase
VRRDVFSRALRRLGVRWHIVSNEVPEYAAVVLASGLTPHFPRYRRPIALWSHQDQFHTLQL